MEKLNFRRLYSTLKLAITVGRLFVVLLSEEGMTIGEENMIALDVHKHNVCGAAYMKQDYELIGENDLFFS